LVLALAERLTGKPEQFSELIDHDLPSDAWLIELPFALARKGLVDEAVRVGDALAELDEPNRALFASDVAAFCSTRASASSRHPASARIASSRSATARARGDAQGIADANERLSRLLQDQPGREREATAAQEEMQRAHRAAFAGARVAVKIGQRPLPVRQRPQVQALLRRLTATDSRHPRPVRRLGRGRPKPSATSPAPAERRSCSVPTRRQQGDPCGRVSWPFRCATASEGPHTAELRLWRWCEHRGGVVAAACGHG